MTSVVILGETGVGKEVLAASIHAASMRAGPMRQVNFAALSETLIESELFGHERGAFAGATSQRVGHLEAAAGGTLFLNEIGDATATTQAKLLRAIEQREVMRLGSSQPCPVDVRFIVATNRDLTPDVAAGRFRADLYYHLDGVTLFIPPLRDRPEAIAPLALGFLAAANARSGSSIQIDAAALEALTTHRWPGNVRELKAVVERASLLALDGTITQRQLVFSPHQDPIGTVASGDTLAPEQRADRDRILQALADCAGNQSRAAIALGISRTTLITKLRIYKIRRPHRPAGR